MVPSEHAPSSSTSHEVDLAHVPASEAPLELRLFRLLTLAGFVVPVFVIVPLNILQGLSTWLNVALVGFGLLCLVLYRESETRPPQVRTFVALAFLVTDASWLFGGGSSGSIPMFLVVVVMLVVVFFAGRTRLYVLGLCLLNAEALVWIEFHRPGWIVAFATLADRRVELYAGAVTSTLMGAVVIWTVVSSYRIEHARLQSANERLQHTLDEVRTLEGLLPICAWCKKIRDDEGYWQRIDKYVTEHTAATFTHGICPECESKLGSVSDDAPTADEPG